MILDTLLGLDEERRSRFQPVTGAGVGRDATLNQVFGGGRKTSSGVDVDEESCLGLSAAYAAARLNCWTVSGLPLRAYERKPNGDRDPRRDNQADRLLNDEANPEMTGPLFREIAQYFTLQWGRSISFIERDGSGMVMGLWPMHTEQVRLDRNERNERTYDIRRVLDDGEMRGDLPKPPTTKKLLGTSDVLDIPNFLGKSVVSFAADSMGEALAAQQLGGGFYAGGSLYAFAVKHPKRLTPEAAEKLRTQLHEVHGMKRRIPVLDEGMELDKFGMPLKDAQFLESRMFYITEIARWYGVPPHKLRDLTRATFSNIAEQKLEWQEDLLPWTIRWEKECNRKLFGIEGKRRFYVEHNFDNFLKADVVKRNGAYEIAVRNGWMSRDEVRKKENMNSMGPGGKAYTVQSQNVNIKQAIKQEMPQPNVPPNTPAPAPENNPQKPPGGQVPPKPAPPKPARNTEAARAAILDAWERVVAKDGAEVRKAGAEQNGNFVEWLDVHYSERGQFWSKANRILTSAARRCRQLGTKVYGEGWAAEYFKEAHRTYLKVAGEVTPDKFAERLAAETHRRRGAIPREKTEEVI